MYWNQNHCYFFLGSVIILEFSVQNKYALRQQKIQAFSYFLVGKYFMLVIHIWLEVPQRKNLRT